MSTHQPSAATVHPHVLVFTAGRNATSHDVHRFCTDVVNRSQGVTDGIVAFLRESGKEGRATSSAGQWTIQVGAAADDAAPGLPAQARPTTAVNIAIRAQPADYPHVVYALNNFFANWRAVTGLSAVNATRVEASWLLQVTQMP